MDGGQTATRAFARRFTRAQIRSDFDRELEEIGLSGKTPWMAALVLYGSGGAIALGAALIWPDVINTGIRWLAGVAIAMAVFSLYGLKRMPNSMWAAHVRVLVGQLVLFLGGLVSGNLALAMGILLIFPLISPACMYSARVAIFYTVIASAELVVILARPELSSWYLVQTIVTVTVVVTIVGLLIVSQVRMRALIRANRAHAMADPLTGLANTRRLEEAIGHELETMAESGRSPALFAIDLDNFKQVNDTFDHHTGDLVLIAVAEALRTGAEAEDVAARRGGDEFSLLVADVVGRDLDALAESIQREIVRARVKTCPGVTPTASVAYTLARPRDDFGTLVARADAQLHERKLKFHGGRMRRRGRETDVSAAAAQARDGAAAPGREATGEDRLVVRVGGDRWALLSIYAVLVGALLVMLPTLGVSGSFGMLEGAVAGGVCAIAAVTAQWRLLRRLGDPLMYVLFLAVSGSVTAAMLWAGPAGNGLIDLYVLAAMIGFFLFTPRWAIFWTLLSVTVPATIAVSAAYPNAVMRMAATTAIIAVVAGLSLKIRSVNQKFAESNAQLARTDALTGLANMRALRERIDSLPTSPPIALIAIDLDEFKLVNDTISHSFGDMLLRSVADTIVATLDVGDLPARRGGDEFYIVCGCDGPRVEQLAERIGDAISAVRHELCPTINPAATVVCVRSVSGDSTEDLLRRADLELHDGKAASRRIRGGHLGWAG